MFDVRTAMTNILDKTSLADVVDGTVSNPVSNPA
jgi:DNA-binding IscR family transcriptional regulator